MLWQVGLPLRPKQSVGATVQINKNLGAFRAHQEHVLVELWAHQKHVLLDLRAQQTAQIESKVVILAIFTRITPNKVKLLYL